MIPRWNQKELAKKEVVHRHPRDRRQKEPLVHLWDLEPSLRPVLQLRKEFTVLHELDPQRGLERASLCLLRASHPVSREPSLRRKPEKLALLQLDRCVLPLQTEDAPPSTEALHEERLVQEDVDPVPRQEHLQHVEDRVDCLPHREHCQRQPPHLQPVLEAFASQEKVLEKLRLVSSLVQEVESLPEPASVVLVLAQLQQEEALLQDPRVHHRLL